MRLNADQLRSSEKAPSNYSARRNESAYYPEGHLTHLTTMEMAELQFKLEDGENSRQTVVAGDEFNVMSQVWADPRKSEIEGMYLSETSYPQEGESSPQAGDTLPAEIKRNPYTHE